MDEDKLRETLFAAGVAIGAGAGVVLDDLALGLGFGMAGSAALVVIQDRVRFGARSRSTVLSVISAGVSAGIVVGYLVGTLLFEPDWYPAACALAGGLVCGIAASGIALRRTKPD